MRGLVVLIFLLGCFFSHAQTLNPVWAESGNCNSTNGFGEGNRVTVDNSGNSYITGFFYGGTINFGNITLTSAPTDIPLFLAKYDPNGQALWALKIGGPNTSIGTCICTDPLANVYLGGYLGFGDTSFVAKISPSGNIMWMRYALDGPDINSLAVDDKANVYLAGRFMGSMRIGTDTLTNNNTGSAFISKFDSAGNYSWTEQSFSQNLTDEATGIAIVNDSIPVITGAYYGGPITFGSYTLNYTGGSDIFIACYDPNGNVSWAQKASGPGSDQSNYIFSKGGRIYITGSFSSDTLNLGSTQLPNSNQNGMDYFIARYSSSGSLLWTKNAAGNGLSLIGYSCFADQYGNAFVTGAFNGSTSFGTVNVPYPQGGTDPMFIAKYDSLGNIIYAQGFSSGGDDQSSVFVTPNGQIFIGGDYESNPFILGNYSLPLTSQEDIFIAKFYESPDAAGGIYQENDLELFPNPSTGKLIIHPPVETYSNNSEIIIYDLFGNEVTRTKLSGCNVEIDLTGSSPGIYLAKVNTGRAQYVRKFVLTP